ncbi:hypothetical protein Pla110_33050 [Polystyrenella longa]|uniref:Uncharacterized protein n=1 Tax=Polystyrenella longa TaxID=2528007 RepID=A0A518CQR4_9PLAN|nr:hypothetical protein [Polystyrenella longa]QDU81563.1 hypothetical protein Pla110_33050 [Polystyrenella longa]
MSFVAFGNESFPFRLKDGNTYDFSALSYGDWSEVENYIQFKDYHTLAKTVSDPVMLGKVLDRCLDKQVSPNNLQESLNNLNTQQFVLWMSVRKKHPNMDIDQFGCLLELTKTAELSEKVMSISVDMSDGSSSEASGPTKKKTGTKKATGN